MGNYKTGKNEKYIRNGVGIYNNSAIVNQSVWISSH
jgi:hypothetical protein